MKKFSKEAIIGLVTLISASLLYFGFNYLKGVNLFKPTNFYYVQITEAVGVEVSTPVYVEGFKIGLVRDIEYNYDNYNADLFIKIELDKKMRVTEGSHIVLSSSFLSGGSLNLQLNKSATTFLTPGDTIQGRRQTDMMQQVEAEILPDVVALLPKIDSILAGLNSIVNHPALEQSLTHIQHTTRNLETSTASLNRMMQNDVPKILGNVSVITENLETTSEHLKSINLTATFSSIEATISNLQMLSDKFNNKDNTVGLLLNDKTLYDNLDSTIVNANRLLIDLKQNPKRYVHFSVF